MKKIIEMFFLHQFLCPLRTFCMERQVHTHPQSKTSRRKQKKKDISFRIQIQEEPTCDEDNIFEDSYTKVQINLHKYGEKEAGDCWVRHL